MKKWKNRKRYKKYLYRKYLIWKFGQLIKENIEKMVGMPLPNRKIEWENHKVVQEFGIVIPIEEMKNNENRTK